MAGRGEAVQVQAEDAEEVSEHTILDPYGTPYGGHRDNALSYARVGSNRYEDDSYYERYLYRYIDLLNPDFNPDLYNNKG